MALALHTSLPMHRRLALLIATFLFGVRPAHAAEKRPVPDYDGRGNADAHRQSPALWIPRVALWPLEIVHEHIVRRPLAALVTTAERHRWPAKVHDLLTFGPHQQDFVTPTAVYEFGLQPSLGAYLSMSDAVVDGNALLAHGAIGGPSWLAATAVDRYTWRQRRTSVAVSASAIRRPDYLFLGTGPDVTSATRARYGRQRFDARAILSSAVYGAWSASLALGAQETSFRPAECCGDPTLDERIADGTLAAPPGYGPAYATAFQRLEVAFDSRVVPPAPGSGAFVRLHGQSSFDLAGDRRWIEYGGAAGGALDLDGHRRLLEVEAAVDLVDPLTGSVPFDELAALDATLMPGFVAGWMNGRSTLAGQVAYTWPIWIWLDGEVRIAAGNAFDARLDGLAPGALRLSGDVGITSIGPRDSGFELVFGVGTETLEQGARIDSVRVAIRTRRGL